MKDARMRNVSKNMRNMRLTPAAAKASTTTTISNPGERGGSAAARKRNSYLAVKMRYLSSLNIEHNVEVTSSMAADSKADDAAAEKLDIQEIEQEFLTDLKLLRSLLSSYTSLTLSKRRMEKKKVALTANGGGGAAASEGAGVAKKALSETSKQND
mmetsp:Transcript_22716/g.36591  ORF Transcript_22716/g.36591 Transcript_22716/m.36591 type:complete len:156 (-) Transcript_22716:93-560(-)